MSWQPIRLLPESLPDRDLYSSIRKAVGFISADDRPWLARQVGLTMGIQQADVTEAVQVFLSRIRQTTATATGTAGDAAEVITAPGPSTAERRSLETALEKASRDGIASIGTAQLVLLLLVWLVAIGLPMVQQALPPEGQTVLNNEYGTIGIAVALTLVLLQKQK